MLNMQTSRARGECITYNLFAILIIDKSAKSVPMEGDDFELDADNTMSPIYIAQRIKLDHR